jgi:hypothetical protein
MKQLIILLLVVITLLIGFGKYNEYKRFNTEAISYKTSKEIDFNYHDKTMVLSYFEAIENLNSFTTLQWSLNSIDVRKPADEDDETIAAVKKYAKKLANVKFYEAILQNSFKLKKEGITNIDIKSIELSSKTIAELKKENKNNTYKDLILNLYKTTKKANYGQRSELIFETQKLLVKSGLDIKIDGLYKIETSNAIKTFESKNNLFPDGRLDMLTLKTLLD